MSTFEMSQTGGGAEPAKDVKDMAYYLAKPTPDPDFSSRFELVMVFKLILEDGVYTQTSTCKHIIHSLVEAGLEIFTYPSIMDDELYALISAPFKILEKFADEIDYNLLLDPEKAKDNLKFGNSEKEIRGVTICQDEVVTKYITEILPFSYIFGKFDEDIYKDRPLLYHRDDNVYEELKEKVDENGDKINPEGRHPFNRNHRIKLLYYLIKAPKSKGGCALELRKYLLANDIEAMYPLHHEKKLDPIREESLAMFTFPWTQPFDQIRDYFGEKIALYYQFMGHYTLWLVVPAIIGVVVQQLVWSKPDYPLNLAKYQLNITASPPTGYDPQVFQGLYAFIMSLWAVVMLEYWKQKESRIALTWGMTQFEAAEPDRPEYIGKPMKSYIDGSDMLYFPPKEAKTRLSQSVSIVLAFGSLVVGIVFGIYAIRESLSKGDSASYASIAASILNAIQIQVMNAIYAKVSVSLNDAENHRTDTNYEDSLITKTFVFQFINSYISFFFLAFILPFSTKYESQTPTSQQYQDASPEEQANFDLYQGQCNSYSCMVPLALNVTIILGTALTLNTVLGILLPYMAWKGRKAEETQIEGSDEFIPEEKLTPAEKEYLLMEYDTMQTSIADYADTAIQYGYLTLFVTALPIAPFFTVIINNVKMKLSTYKLTKYYQRPLLLGAQDIGTWQAIYATMSVIAVVTNAGILCFTMNLSLFNPVYNSEFECLSGCQNPIWFFIYFQWILISFQAFLGAYIPDKTEDVEVQEARLDFIIDKLILFVPDENYECEAEAIKHDEMRAELDKDNSRFSKVNAESEEEEGCTITTCAPVVLQPFCANTLGCGPVPNRYKNLSAIDIVDKAPLPLLQYPTTSTTGVLITSDNIDQICKVQGSVTNAGNYYNNQPQAAMSVNPMIGK
jgi:anoctamin-10/anoctamin-7